MSMTLRVRRERQPEPGVGIVYTATYFLILDSHEKEQIRRYGFGPLRTVLRTAFTPAIPQAMPPEESEIQAALSALIDLEKGLPISRDTFTAFSDIHAALIAAIQSLRGYWEEAATWTDGLDLVRVD